MPNEWTKPEHAIQYLNRADEIPQRKAGEETLLSELHHGARRILDLGCGDGRLLALALTRCPSAQGIALDFSSAMLQRARQRFANDDRVTVIEHDLERKLPEIGKFDIVCSSFAIHHLPDERKRTLYEEAWALLNDGGVFCNLEHVSSPTDAVHAKFLEAMGITPGNEDPSNKLLDVETQLRWLREIGFSDVDCYWKWRELALMVGRKNETVTMMADA